MSLVLISPIPPIKSGTADYFKTFLELVLKVYDASEVKIVVNDDNYPKIVRSFMGVGVSDYRSFVFSKNDTVLYFTSNNHFHHYVLEAIRSFVPAKKIAVIHDVQCAMAALELMDKDKFGFSKNHFEEFFGSEFKEDRTGLFDFYRFARLPVLMRYLASGQDFVIDHCNELWTHSYYGFSKLAFESGALLKGKKIQVIQMPKEYEKPQALEKPKKFIAGIFGFVAPHKRIHSVMTGFTQFLNEISESDRKSVELIVVGANSDPESCNPDAMIDTLNIREYAKNYGFVTLEDMEKLIEKSSVIFNLRFPSCGETSATLRRAQDLGVKVVGSRYQAFAEEDLDDFCSIESNLEVLDIKRVLHKYFLEFKTGAPAPSLEMQSVLKEKASVLTMLTNLKNNVV